MIERTCTLPLVAVLLVAQSTPAQSTSGNPAGSNSPGIRDNSFLIEEAYNQEDGVVQHISNFIRSRGGRWVYSFTQEWPTPGVKHQLSYTILGQRVRESNRFDTGVGDILVNYRYQLVGDGDAKLAVAPRFSLILPTGDSSKSLGTGATGVQLNLPVSVNLSNRFATHFNAGATYLPSAKNRMRESADISAYNLGHGIIYQPSSRFNMLVETVWVRSRDVIGRGRTESSDEVLINPGVRWAHNFKSGLQIVPGVSAPLGVGPSRGERSILFYLSFEHPFRRAR